MLKFSFHPFLLQVYQSCHLEVDGAAQHHWTVQSAGAVLRHTVGADSHSTAHTQWSSSFRGLLP